MATDPNAVTATSPNMDQTQIPASTQLQPPAPGPTAPASIPAQAATPPSPGSSFRHLAPAMIGSILGSLAGTPTPSYSVDESGKMVATPAAPLTTTQKIKAIAANALIGLSAPAPEKEKSGLANALAGVGAGAKAVQEKNLQQDTLKRAQAQENFETQQQTTLRKYQVAHQNALTMSTYFANKKLANEMDPHYKQNESLFNAVQASPELGAHAHELSDSQVEQEVKKDPTFWATHIIKPLGWAPETDANGQQVMVDGQPKFYMRMAVIDGTQDGKIKVTPEMAEDFQKYGPMARIPNADSIKAGDEYELTSLLPAMNRVEEQRKAVLDGWAKAELGWSTDPKDPTKENPVLINRVLPPGSPDAVKPLGPVTPLPLKQEEGKTELQKAQAAEADAKAKEALANAALISGNIGNGGQAAIPAYLDAIGKLPESSQAILRNVPPMQQAALLKVANGDADINKIFPTRTTKGSGQLDAAHAATLTSLLNPRWTEGLYNTKQSAQKSFADGEDGKAIASFGQFLVHADDVRMGSDRLQRTNSPWFNEPINTIKSKGMGNPGVPGLMADIFAARSEWQNFIKNGHASDLADSEQGRQIMSDSSSPAQIMRALQEMGKQAVGRLDQIDGKWRRTWGGHYPGLITDSARTAANNLGLGDYIKQYPSESGAMFGVQPNSEQIQSPDNPAQRPAGATGIAPGSDGKMYYHDIQGNILGPAPNLP
jgi:hypothetical protein